MKYTEFTKFISNLGKDYRVIQQDKHIYVTYKGDEILHVCKQITFVLDSYYEINDCPKTQEVWDAATALAATPLDEREEEKKYNVIVGIARDDEFEFPYVVWAKDDVKSYLLATADSNGLKKDSDFQFTESEFKDLIEYIKTLPGGEFQVKVAEHGKRLVNEDKRND